VRSVCNYSAAYTAAYHCSYKETKRICR